MEEVGAAELGVEQGGCGCPDIGPDLLGGGSVSHAVWVGDVGHEILCWEGFGKIPPPGCPQAHVEETSKVTGNSMGIPPARGRDARGEIAGGEELRLPPPEHSHTVYCT